MFVLRKFFPLCPLSYATKLFPKRRLCGKKTPSVNSMLLPANAQGSGFLLNTQQHCFQGKGERGTMFRKMLPKYTIFPTVLSKIVDRESGLIMPDDGRLVQRCRECPRSNSCLGGVILLGTLSRDQYTTNYYLSKGSFYSLVAIIKSRQ